MKEELLKALQPLIESLSKNGLAVIDSIQEQAPLICGELLTYNGWASALKIMIALPAFVGFSIWMYKDIRAVGTGKDSIIDASEGTVIMLWTPIWLGSFAVGIVNTFVLIKILTAPRLYLLEYIMALM